jgi:N-acetylmuramoyl-L-alanine amidase
MKKIYYLFTFLCCYANAAFSQQNETNIAQQINSFLEHEHSHLPKTAFNFKADSIVINNNILKVYFNTSKSYTRNTLPADYIEMLPELFMQFAVKTNTQAVQLFAKEQATGTYKSIEYFANHPEVPVYKEPTNSDSKIVKFELNQKSTNKVFPSVSNMAVPTGALAGKTVWLSPGHGWHNTGNGFVTQRGTTNEIVEDFTTIETINNYLLNYLYNAGANVWSVRERDNNTNEVIVDNDNLSSGYTETGTWTTGSLPGYGGTYRVATATVNETASAIITPNVTSSGLYWVSVRCIAGANRPTDVSYTIIHSGDTSYATVNQEIHSDTWVYLGQYYFTSGSLNKIIISNKSSQVGEVVIADAVRLGGGVGNMVDCLNPSHGVSGRARHDESARQYAQFQKYPTCNEDVTVRPRFAEYELAKGAPSEINNAVYVSFHTNAGGGTGTETYSYNGSGSGRPNITVGSDRLRDSIHNQIIADIRAGWRATWSNRGVKTANFGELRELNTIPGTLVELAFHDLAADAADLRHPEFRRLAARAMYKGIVNFFRARDNSPLVYLPEQPINVVAKNIGNNNIQISWAAPPFGGINGHAATGYKVYTSTNGKSFKDGIAISGTTFTFNGNAQTTYFFKVTATNDGGESFASSVIAARTPAANIAAIPYLIVDGFDRIDGSALIPKTESVALGVVKRMYLDRMNRYDYMIEHALALATCNNMAFDGCQNEAVTSGNVLLSNYVGVDWFTGEESVTDRSFDTNEKNLIKNYLNAGGNMLISGSEIGWDIGRAASANFDADFYNNYLKASFVGDDATTYDFAGTTTLFNTQSGTFDNSINGYYDVDFPDRISTNGGSNIALNYVGGTADGAAVGFKGAYNLLYFAFPFEAITSAIVRNNLMCNVVAYLTPTVLPATGLEISGKNEGLSNHIAFTTKAEINVKEMWVQRSESGIFFNDISYAFAPKGNWNTGANYTYKDVAILPTAYYRIKVLDNDGKVSFSKAIKISNAQNNILFSVLTNPAANNIKIQIVGGKPVQIMVANAVGQKVYTQKMEASANGILNIPIQGFSKGIYTITVHNGQQQQIEKVVVQ